MVSARPASLTSDRARRQPRAARAWARARPMPEPAPVTTATLFFRSFMAGASCCGLPIKAASAYFATLEARQHQTYGTGLRAVPAVGPVGALSQQVIQRLVVTRCKDLQKVAHLRQSVCVQPGADLGFGGHEFRVAGTDFRPALEPGREPVSRLDQFLFLLSQPGLPNIGREVIPEIGRQQGQ